MWVGHANEINGNMEKCEKYEENEIRKKLNKIIFTMTTTTRSVTISILKKSRVLILALTPSITAHKCWRENP
jgi:hypothetical protein